MILIVIVKAQFCSISPRPRRHRYSVSGRRSRLSDMITTSAASAAIAVPPLPIATPKVAPVYHTYNSVISKLALILHQYTVILLNAYSLYVPARATASLMPSPTIHTCCPLVCSLSVTHCSLSRGNRRAWHPTVGSIPTSSHT